MVESDLPDDDTFDQKLRDGTIHPDMQRKDAGRRPVENLGCFGPSRKPPWPPLGSAVWGRPAASGHERRRSVGPNPVCCVSQTIPRYGHGGGYPSFIFPRRA